MAERCTGITAFVRSVIAPATRFTSMVRVRGSMSTNTGVAPAYRMAATVAMNVKGTVIGYYMLWLQLA